MVLRLGYVAGVSPGRWLRTWAERRPDQPLEATRVDESEQLEALRAGEHDVAFVRLPIDDEGLHSVALWEELAVVVLPKEHPLADAEALESADLDGEIVAPAHDGPAMTIELVAAGTGYAIVPHSIARLHQRKDVVAIPVADAPATRIALVWRIDRDDADIQEFVGVVRGRTARSSRGDDSDDAEQTKPAKAGAKQGAGRGASARSSSRTVRGGAARRSGGKGAGGKSSGGTGRGKRR